MNETRTNKKIMEKELTFATDMIDACNRKTWKKGDKVMGSESCEKYVYVMWYGLYPKSLFEEYRVKQ